MIALLKQAKIEVHLIILAGTREKRRLIDMQAMGEKAFIKFNKTECTKDKLLNALLGFHCFTGCHSTGAFAGRGKIKPVSLMGTCQEYVEAFSDLGASSDVSDSTVSDLHIFTCHMYGEKNVHSQGISTNDLRYNIYCQKAGKIPCDALPPCWNTLKQHIKKVNFQTRIWRKCLQAWVEEDPQVGHGWYMEG